MRSDLPGCWHGMVASLRRVATRQLGRVVLVQSAAVPQRFEAAGAKLPAWWVVALGRPLRLDGQDEREVTVAEPCLKPLRRLTARRAKAVARGLAWRDFNAATAALKRRLETHPMTDEELEETMTGALGFLLSDAAVDRRLRLVVPMVSTAP